MPIRAQDRGRGRNQAPKDTDDDERDDGFPHWFRQATWVLGGGVATAFVVISIARFAFLDTIAENSRVNQEQETAIRAGFKTVYEHLALLDREVDQIEADLKSFQVRYADTAKADWSREQENLERVRERYREIEQRLAILEAGCPAARKR